MNPDQFEFPYPIPIIKSTSQTGLIEIIYTKPLIKKLLDLDLHTLEYKVETDLYEPSLTVEVEPYIMQDPKNVLFTWKIIQ